MPSFDDFLAELKEEVKELVEKSWKDLKEAAIHDAEAFLFKAEGDLRRWTQLLATGALTSQDFEFLLGAKKEVAELGALEQAGLAQVQLDRFMNGVVGAIINAATKIFL